MGHAKAKLNGSVEQLAVALRNVVSEAIAESESRIEPKLDQLAKSIKELERKSQNRHKDALTRINQISR